MSTHDRQLQTVARDSDRMNVQASIEQVAGILARESLEFQTHADGASYRLVFGHDAVFVHFCEWDGGVRIFLASPALQGIDMEGAGGALVLANLNDLNRHHEFVKWFLDEGTLFAAYDLLGDDLQHSELINAVYTLAGAVDLAAGDLASGTGGLRYAETCDASPD